MTSGSLLTLPPAVGRAHATACAICRERMVTRSAGCVRRVWVIHRVQGILATPAKELRWLHQNDDGRIGHCALEYTHRVVHRWPSQDTRMEDSCGDLRRIRILDPTQSTRCCDHRLNPPTPPRARDSITSATRDSVH